MASCIGNGEMNLFTTALDAYCMVHCFIHMPAAPFMVYCKISLMSVISPDTPTSSCIPMCRNKLNFDKLFDACFLFLLALLFFGTVSVHIS